VLAQVGRNGVEEPVLSLPKESRRFRATPLGTPRDPSTALCPLCRLRSAQDDTPFESSSHTKNHAACLGLEDDTQVEFWDAFYEAVPAIAAAVALKTEIARAGVYP
jgi:hypothetical protein